MTIKLEDWSIITSAGFFTGSAVPRRACIEGRVVEDTNGRFPRGQRIYTSQLKYISFSLNKARTSNQEFILGPINPDFAMLIENSPFNSDAYETNINLVKLVKTEASDKKPVWRIHKIVMNDGTLAVALVSFKDGTWKVVVRGSGYSVVNAGALVAELDSESLQVLKALPDSPCKYQPYMDFIGGG